MSVIQVNCTDQALSVTNSPMISSEGVKEDYIQFTFCSLWDGYGKTAVFYRDEDHVYNVVVDSEDKCLIPVEVLRGEGTIYFGVFGVSGDIRRTSEILKYKIKKGAYFSSSGTGDDPTPDVYSQLTSQLGSLQSTTEGHTTELATHNSELESLDGRVTDCETDISSIDGRVTTCETNITSIDGRVDTCEEAIPTKQAQHTKATVTLDSDGWASNQQTVNVTGVTATNTVIISADPASIFDYGNFGVYCSSQADGTLTFTCGMPPTSDITVNVVILGVSA